MNSIIVLAIQNSHNYEIVKYSTSHKYGELNINYCVFIFVIFVKYLFIFSTKFHIVSIFFIISLVACVNGHKKVLFIAPINGHSHWNYLKIFIRELINREYDVTCITSIRMNDKSLSNYTEILIDPPFNLVNMSMCSKI